MALEDTLQTIGQEYSALLAENAQLMKRPEAIGEIAQTLEELRLAERRNETDARKEWARRLGALTVMYLVDCTP